MIFSHAWLGCNTTLDQGKIPGMKLLAKSPEAYHEAMRFLHDGKSQNEIEESGSLILRLLYGGKK